MPMRDPFMAGVAVAWLVGGSAQAGPPYVTDDPVPTDRGHWETYAFAAGTHVPGSTSGAAGIDINYGGARDLQLTCVVPLAYERSDGMHAGLGVIETAMKYRFVHQVDGKATPDIAFFPRIFWPSASARFGSRHASVLLPIWAGKDLDRWSVFGGGGYQINPGEGNRDFWLAGLAVTRAIGDWLTAGVEIYHRSPDAEDGKPFSGANLGATWNVSGHWTVLGSLGPGLQNAREEGQYSFYLALQAAY
jgi:hypothetical protein